MGLDRGSQHVPAARRLAAPGGGLRAPAAALAPAASIQRQQVGRVLQQAHALQEGAHLGRALRLGNCTRSLKSPLKELRARGGHGRAGVDHTFKAWTQTLEVEGIHGAEVAQQAALAQQAAWDPPCTCLQLQDRRGPSQCAGQGLR